MRRNTLKAGLRAFVFIEPDRLSALEGDLGALAIEDLLEAVGELLHSLLQPGDIAGRVTARGFALLVERGNTRDLDAWVGRVLQRIAEHVFHVGERSVSVTCSAGATLLNSQRRSAAGAARVIDQGGARRSRRPAATDCCARTSPATKPDLEEADRAWATRIRSALMANRFRLVQQPIASLVGDGEAMFDLVVRMLDDKGNEVLPSEFMAAAQRTDLMKNIDRWVVGAAMSFCAARKPHRVFVRLSRDSMRDQTLGNWLQQQLKASGVEAGRVVFEVGEALATTHLKEMKELQALVAAARFRARDRELRLGRDPAQLLSHVPVNYVKIDGALMQGLANDRPLQEQVKVLVQEARTHGVTTIAERVEDANTMAVLWQLGIEFIQGYFVSSPEEVVLGA